MSRRARTDIRWYRRELRAEREFLTELSLEEYGGFCAVRDMMVAACGHLLDDDRFIAGNLRIDLRPWRRIKKKLLLGGLLFQRTLAGENILCSVETDQLILEALRLIEAAREAGKKSGSKRKAKRKAGSSNSSSLTGTTVETGAGTTVQTKNNLLIKKEEACVPAPPLALSVGASDACHAALVDLESAFAKEFGRTQAANTLRDVAIEVEADSVLILAPTDWRARYIKERFSAALDRHFTQQRMRWSITTKPRKDAA